MKRRVDLTKKKGAASWLSVLLLDDHGFSLHKGARSRMQSVCVMVGRFRILLPNAIVAQPSQPIMPSFALWVASLQYDTMNYVI